MPDRRLIRFARELRQNQTEAEIRIWSHLRSGRLSGDKFRRQHPIEPYIADFYCHSEKLVLELDGSQHFEPEAVEYDRVRSEHFKSLGIRVLRFNDVEALRETEAVIMTILRELELNQKS